ncbi:MAG: CreA family protein [Methyloceanibacter sp.]
MRIFPKTCSHVPILFGVLLSLAAAGPAQADDVACVSTTFRMLSPSDKVCVSQFDDPKVPGIACYISQARKGGWGQPLGLNEDPSNFSVTCRQMGPITVDIATLPEREEAFSEKTSIFFKKTRIYRLPDLKRNTIVYLAISSKIIEGSPANSVSAVPVMPWPASDPSKEPAKGTATP